MRSIGKITIAAALCAIGAHAHDIDFEHTHQDGGYTVTDNGSFVSDNDVTAFLWNPRGKSDEKIAERIAFLSKHYFVQRTPDELRRARATRAKYADAIAINSVMPGAVHLMGYTRDHYLMGLKSNYDGGMTLVNASVYGNPSSNSVPVETTVVETDLAGESFGVTKVRTVDDIREAKLQGNLSVVYNTQGADYVIEAIRSRTEWSEKVGIKVMNLTYNNDNALAGGGTNQSSGLTEAGREFVLAMNEAGITVDCSHASNQTCIDAARITKKPMVASHSNVFALFEHSRNLSDEAIIAIGPTGGAVCPTGAGGFLSRGEPVGRGRGGGHGRCAGRQAAECRSAGSPRCSLEHSRGRCPLGFG
ncbi:MAG: membrane dipeptidase [Pseudomonadota bacterium]